jgi:hypothetical protein
MPIKGHDFDDAKDRAGRGMQEINPDMGQLRLKRHDLIRPLVRIVEREALGAGHR